VNNYCYVIDKKKQKNNHHQSQPNIMLTIIRADYGYILIARTISSFVTLISVDFYLLGSKVSSYVKSTRVKQVMADLALVHVAHHGVHFLNQSEYRRLAIGIQLVCSWLKPISLPNSFFLI
jgi:hypothetical protein